MKRGFPVEVLWCPNPSKRILVASGGARRTGWKFPTAVRKQLELDTQGKSVLQLFGGQSTFGTKLDIDRDTSPHVIGDAWVPPFRQDSFDVVIMDPPYTALNAQMKHALFCAANNIARETVIWFSTLWCAASSGLRCEKAYLVRVGDSCNVRCLQYFSIREKVQPAKFFKRGPAMKYNRWLANPNSLNLQDVAPDPEAEIACK
jgi:hypothetical protein